MSQAKQIRSLRSMRRMPLPHTPYVDYYGERECGSAHHIRLFPAVLREKGVPSAEAILEEGQSACFFHPKQPATAICSISGRMICELCTTTWEGEKVSFEALQTMLKKRSGKARARGRIKWDDVALSLAVLPLLFPLVTILTAPVALGISLWFWRKGVTSPVRQSRWRYVVAVLFSLLQLGFWLWLIFTQNVFG